MKAYSDRKVSTLSEYAFFFVPLLYNSEVMSKKSGYPLVYLYRDYSSGVRPLSRSLTVKLRYLTIIDEKNNDIQRDLKNEKNTLKISNHKTRYLFLQLLLNIDFNRYRV